MRDLRVLLRLAGEARELIEANRCAREHVLTEIARLLRASVAVEGTIALHGGRPLSVAAPLLELGWGCQADQRRFEVFLSTHPIEADPLIAAGMRSRRRIATLSGAEAVPRTQWTRGVVHELHRAAGVGDSLMSLHRLPGNGVAHAMVFKRAAGEASFRAEERDLLTAFHTECLWMFRERAPGLDRLTARERSIVALAAHGHTNKVIAYDLGLAHSTVRVLLARAAAKLGVRSRSALIAFARAADTFTAHTENA